MESCVLSLSNTLPASERPRSLASCSAFVTGASSGIGRAVAVALAAAGAHMCLIGRNGNELSRTAAAAEQFGHRAICCRADLTQAGDVSGIIRVAEEEFGGVDILVLCAGIIHLAPTRTARVEDFDQQYFANVRAPYLLAQSLLPLLKTRRGQIVFLNSTTGLSAKRADVGQFAATMFAVRAIAESLREEVNGDGIRVLSVHPGKTATPRQERLHRVNGQPYRPENLQQPSDIATMVVTALTLPRTTEVTDIMMRPMKKT